MLIKIIVKKSYHIIETINFEFFVGVKPYLPIIPEGSVYLTVLLYILASYAYGSVLFPVLFTSLIAKKKLTEGGSKNQGVANAFRVGGKVVGYLAVVGEISKAFFPFFVSTFLLHGSKVYMMFGLLFIVLGSIYPVFLRFKGGKARTVAGWGIFFVSPITLAFLTGIWVFVMLITKKTRLATIFTIIAISPVMFFVEKNYFIFIMAIFLSFLLYFGARKKTNDFSYYGVFKEK